MKDPTQGAAGPETADVPAESELLHWESRAPGWRIRCLRCGFTEHWGKYGIRLAAFAWRNYTLGRCPRCHRICCHAIEKKKTPRNKGS